MGESLDREKVIKNKKEGIRHINNLLEKFIEEDCLKKANLISYWMKDYAKMIEFEKQFDPKRNIAYKRGDILKVNLGFRIGSEYGGLHYAVVLDSANAHASPVVTIVPLTSAKVGATALRSSNVDLGDELYRLLRLKHNTLSSALDCNLEQKREALKEIKELYSIVKAVNHKEIEVVDGDKSITIDWEETKENVEKMMSSKESELSYLERESITLNKIKDEIRRMKSGSIAVTNQITTISKIRIQDPRNSSGVLEGVRLSAESLEKINEQLRRQFTFEK